MDAVILGGGVIGLAIARELAAHGRTVTLVDRRRPGSGASGAAAGMLAPQAECRAPGPLLDLGLVSRDLYPGWIRDIVAGGGEDPQYDRAGTLQVACGAGQQERLEAQADWQARQGLPQTLMTVEALRRRVPGVTREATAGLLLPEDHRVDPARLCRALATSVERLGGILEIGVEIDEFMMSGGKVVGVRLGERVLDAGAVIVAAGCWTGLLPAAAEVAWPEIPPVRGQMIALTGASGAALQPGAPAVISEFGYALPRRSGVVLFGSTMEEAGYRAETTPAAVADLRRRAALLLPGLAGAELESSWAGLRPGTPDGLPLIGEWRGTGALLATGHLRNGILLAPATARAVRALLDGSAPGFDLSPFRPERLHGAASSPAARSPATPAP